MPAMPRSGNGAGLAFTRPTIRQKHCLPKAPTTKNTNRSDMQPYFTPLFCAWFVALFGLANFTFAKDFDFVKDVRPIFEAKCYDCHSGDEQESGLRLDIKAAALKGGDNLGRDIVPGKPQDSPLIELITTTDASIRMPPSDPLSAAEIDILTRWIEQGADWPDGVDTAQLENRLDHWSFKPPSVDASKQTIDQFIHAGLKKHGLTMSPPTDRRTWLRRVTFDLTGLPPTEAETVHFLNDSSGHAYQRVVDRLLASEHYGERWAQHWLDVVRYADTHGFEVNTERPNAWPYRDYVIDAFNRDTPYDEFIKEQIVGDALGKDAATGFLVTASVLLPGQIGKDEASIRLARQDALDEIVNNISQTFLGLSIGCARCHDHKFDPITAHDYYAMQAFVAGVEYEDREIQSPELERSKQSNNQLTTVVPIANPGSKRRSTNSRGNVETFESVEARFVRFTIEDANHHPTLGLIEPCIDEFEIFTDEPTPRNIALAAEGTKVTSSGNRTSAAHQLNHIHDGVYGNASSWMADTAGRGWVVFEFAQPVRINRVVWSRDRTGQFEDRLATAFNLEASLDAEDTGDWTTLSEVVAPLDPVIAGEPNVDRFQPHQSGQLVFAGKFRQPDTIHLLARGDPEQPLDKVPPAIPAAFGDLSLDYQAKEQQRRKVLAEWIASPDNPLTNRVMVNRIWQAHFGQGLVETPSDFGRNGISPSHPQLLDWLASKFVANGWSIKRLHRKIVLSDTYRQSSAIRPDAQRIDADVRWLWRYPSRRMEAEAIRDAMLAICGELNHEMYGRGFSSFQQRGGLSGFTPIEDLNHENRRRMIYAHKVRRETEAVFGAFDCPDAGQSSAVRTLTTTPIQALNLFNSRFTLQVSDAFAKRVIEDCGDSVSDQVDRVYQLVFNRSATDQELTESRPVVEQYGLAVLCRVLFNSNEFVMLP